MLLESLNIPLTMFEGNLIVTLKKLPCPQWSLFCTVLKSKHRKIA